MMWDELENQAHFVDDDPNCKWIGKIDQFWDLVEKEGDYYKSYSTSGRVFRFNDESLSEFYHNTLQDEKEWVNEQYEFVREYLMEEGEFWGINLDDYIPFPATDWPSRFWHLRDFI